MEYWKLGGGVGTMWTPESRHAVKNSGILETGGWVWGGVGRHWKFGGILELWVHWELGSTEDRWI